MNYPASCVTCRGPERVKFDAMFGADVILCGCPGKRMIRAAVKIVPVKRSPKGKALHHKREARECAFCHATYMAATHATSKYCPSPKKCAARAYQADRRRVAEENAQAREGRPRPRMGPILAISGRKWNGL